MNAGAQLTFSFVSCGVPPTVSLFSLEPPPMSSVHIQGLPTSTKPLEASLETGPEVCLLGISMKINLYVVTAMFNVQAVTLNCNCGNQDSPSSGTRVGTTSSCFVV